MFFINLIFINIRRLIKFTLPLFLLAAVIAATIVFAVKTHIAGEEKIEELSKKYVTTVNIVYYPLKTQSGKSYGDAVIITEEDIQPFLEYPEIESFSGLLSYPSMIDLWQINFDPKTLIDDLQIDDMSMLESLLIEGVRNSEYCDYIELIEGDHISDNAKEKYVLLLSDKAAEVLGLEVGDTVIFACEDYPEYELLQYEYKVAGIVASDSYRAYVPYEVLKKHYDINENYAGTPIAGVFHLKFIMSTPDSASAFMEKSYEFFHERYYSLQADDYDYKKEIYPIKMMLNLNDIIAAVIAVVGYVFLFLIIVQSIGVRSREAAAYMLLSCPKKMLLSIFTAEKAIVLFFGFTAGFIAGNIVFYFSGGKTLSFPITALIILTVAFLLGVVVSAASVLYISAKKPMEVIIANE